MTGLYPGLDGFLPNTLTETVNTCLDFMIEAVKNTHTHTHTPNKRARARVRAYKLRLINMEVKVR